MDSPASTFETLVNWVPMLIFLGVWFWFIRRMRHPKTGLSQYEYMEQLLVEQKRFNASQEEMVKLMNRRLERLEELHSPTDHKT